MARLCIYNSSKAVDTRSTPIGMGLVASEAGARRSKPVRLLTPNGETRYVSLEFIYSGNFVSALDLRWFLEFWNDGPSLALPPNLRTAIGLNQNLMWAREITEEVGAAGAITHNVITRTLSLAADTGGVGTARYATIALHSNWVRLALWVNGAIPAGAKLEVYAIVGGHLEEKYLEDNADIPYDYNA